MLMGLALRVLKISTKSPFNYVVLRIVRHSLRCHYSKGDFTKQSNGTIDQGLMLVDTIYLLRPTPNVCPPSTGMTAPVTQAARGSTSWAIHQASSSGSPMRPNATVEVNSSWTLSISSPRVSRIGVAQGPGAMAFTRIPSEASSAARQRVRCSIAALVMEYSAFSTLTHEPTEELRFTIAGAGERRNAGRAN